MRLPSFALAAVVLGGCSPRESGVGPEGLFSSGSRLVARVVVSGDVGAFVDFRDSDHDETCAFEEWRGALTCLPNHPHPTVFVNANCSGYGVVDDPSSGTPPSKFGVHAEPAQYDPFCAEPPPPDPTYVLAGATVVVDTVYSGSGCWAAWIPDDAVVREASVVGPEAFVTGTLEEVVGDGVTGRFVVGSDGSRQPFDLRDDARQVACVVEDTPSGTVCVPAARAHEDWGFADAACTKKFASLAGDGCDPAIVVAAPQGQCGGTPSYHEVGAPVSQWHYLDENGACTLGGDIYWAAAYEFDPQVPAVLPALERETIGSDVPLEVFRSGGEIVATRGRFVDPQLGPCVPEPFSHGAYACVPVGAASASYTNGTFVDPGCFVPVVSVPPEEPSCPSPSFVALRAASPTGTVVVGVHEIGGVVDGKPLYGGGPGGCYLTGQVASGHRTLGDPVDVPILSLAE